MIGVVLRLAFIEYLLPFRRWRYVPGGRDFLWLTAMLALVESLALLLASTQQGVLDRSVDIFLGKEPGYGIPVWVIPNYLRTAGEPEFIDNRMIGKLEAAGFVAVPYRDVSSRGAFQLPTSEAWRGSGTRNPAAGVDDVQFSGWAVDPSGPLWPAEHRHDYGSGQELSTVALNRSLFSGEQFVFKAYKSALKGKIPPQAFKRLEAAGDNPTKLDRMWFTLNVHRDRLVEFRVVWTDSLGLGQPIAFLFPLPLLHTIREARSHPDICLFPDHGWRPSTRVLQLREQISAIRESGPEYTQRLRRLAEMTGGTLSSLGKINVIELSSERSLGRGDRCDPGTDKEFVDRAMSSLDLKLFVSEEIEGDPVTADSEYVSLPCGRIAPASVRRYGASMPDGMPAMPADLLSPECRVRIPVATVDNGYGRVMVYVESRHDLREAVDVLRNFDDGRLRITQIYQDALDRFSFLSDLIETLRVPYGFFLLMFLSLVLIIQLGTLIDHRKIRYGLMLARGMSPTQLCMMVVTQVTIATTVAFAAACACLWVARLQVNESASVLATTFFKITKGQPIDVLPVDPDHLVAVLSVTLVFVVPFSLLHLWFIGVIGRPVIERLMKE